MSAPSAKELIHAIDLTLGKAVVTRAELEAVCAVARKAGVAAVCVNGSRVAQAVHLLEDTAVKVSCFVGFPFGAMDADAKRYEAEAAIDSGAQELDVALNLGRLKDGDGGYVLRELRDIVEAADERTVKVILETGLLTEEEKILACQLIVESGAQFAVLSSASSTANSALDDVKLVRATVGDKFGVKAAFGVAEARTALELIEAGATRLGVEAGRDFVRSLSAAAP